jgi:integrase
MSVRVPKYRLHRGSGQALVEINGRRIYLGRHNSGESREKYRRLIAELMSRRPVVAPVPPSHGPTLGRLILDYYRYAKSYYVKEGQASNELTCIRLALRRLRKLYGRTPAHEFGPKAFKLVRQSLVDEGLSRKYVNDSMSRIRRMFRWAVADELLPPAVYQALAAVPGLQRGRSKAREGRRVVAVPDQVVDATLACLPEVVADMVRLQRLTGMRPAEVCALRPCDIDRVSDVWIYHPAHHKTEHVGKERVIPLGPKAQEILQRYLDRDSREHCLRPCDSERLRRAARHGARKTPLSCGNRPAAGRVRKAVRQPGNRYTTNSYRRAVQRACDKAFPHPSLAGNSDPQRGPDQRAELKAWRRAHRWAPNQLRHSAATEIRKRFGLEAAQIILGHSSANVTQIYAERDAGRANDVARAIG